jgi:hypothetical protein
MQLPSNVHLAKGGEQSAPTYLPTYLPTFHIRRVIPATQAACITERHLLHGSFVATS